MLHTLLKTSLDVAAIAGGGIGLIPPFDAESLFHSAGVPIEDDPDAVEPLTAMCRSLDEDIRLSPRAHLLLGRRYVDALRTRRRLLDREAAGDLPVAEESSPPLVVTGFPRTGTTLAHRLLASAHDARSPQWCELMEPGLLPGEPGRQRRRRLAKWRLAIRLANSMSPSLKRIHEILADGPEECTHLHELAFDTESFALIGPARGYREWLDERDAVRKGMRYEWQVRSMNAIVADRSPADRGDRWVLKAPQHLCQLDDLLETFPGATVIRMHRDPVAAMGSVASLVDATGQLLTPGLPPDHGEELLEIFTEWQSKGDEAMPRHHDRILEVHYDDLVADPMGFIDRVHGHAGLPVDGDHADSVTAHLRRRPKHHFGRHRYRLEDHGLEPDRVRIELADYIDRIDRLKTIPVTA